MSSRADGGAGDGPGPDSAPAAPSLVSVQQRTVVHTAAMLGLGAALGWAAGEGLAPQLRLALASLVSVAVGMLGLPYYLVLLDDELVVRTPFRAQSVRLSGARVSSEGPSYSVGILDQDRRTRASVSCWTVRTRALRHELGTRLIASGAGPDLRPDLRKDLRPSRWAWRRLGVTVTTPHAKGHDPR